MMIERALGADAIFISTSYGEKRCEIVGDWSWCGCWSLKHKTNPIHDILGRFHKRHHTNILYSNTSYNSALLDALTPSQFNYCRYASQLPASDGSGAGIYPHRGWPFWLPNQWYQHECRR